MEILKKLQKFDTRFEYVDDSSHQDNFDDFKTRTLNIVAVVGPLFDLQGNFDFCQLLGEETKSDVMYVVDPNISIESALRRETNDTKFYRILQLISHIPTPTDLRPHRLIFNHKLTEAITISNINLSVTTKNDELIFFRKGEKKFDKVLVDDVIIFLNPNSQKHFVDALNAYSSFSSKNAIKSAESLRRSLEEFLRHKLNNGYGLDRNIQELGKKLKADGRDAIIRNIVVQSFSLLDQYFNENSKHKDGDIDEAENEFLIYQTGLLMRYIDKNF